MSNMVIDSGGAFLYNASMEFESGKAIIFWEEYGLIKFLYIDGWNFILRYTVIVEKEYDSY